jgi:hypothetical protein
MQSEEMYSNIMQQKKIWKDKDVEMDAWSHSTLNKNDNRRLKYSKVLEL